MLLSRLRKSLTPAAPCRKLRSQVMSRSKALTLLCQHLHVLGVPSTQCFSVSLPCGFLDGLAPRVARRNYSCVFMICRRVALCSCADIVHVLVKPILMCCVLFLCADVLLVARAPCAHVLPSVLCGRVASCSLPRLLQCFSVLRGRVVFCCWLCVAM